MSDYIDIDLRKVIRNIFAKWYWIVISTFIVGVAVFLFSFLQPDLYRTTARFVLTQPPYTARFEDEYITNEIKNPSEETLLNIVTSDAIITELFDIWNSPTKADVTLRQFKQEHLEAVIGENGMLVSLVVSTEDRENSAEIANEWCRLAMTAVDSSYFGYETDQLTFFEAQTELAEDELEKAGQALIEFEEKNTIEILNNDLNDQLAIQVDTNQAIRTVESTQGDVRSLIAQLDYTDPDSIVENTHYFSYLLIQTKYFNSPIMIGKAQSVEERTTSSLQLVIDINQLNGTHTVAEFKGMLEDWLGVLDARIDEYKETRLLVKDKITDLQAEIQTLQNELAILESEYNRQNSVYRILSVKLEEVYLTMPDGDSGYVSLVSTAYVPDKADAVPHNTVRNTIIGLVAGGFMGLVSVVIADWWKSSDDSEE